MPILVASHVNGRLVQDADTVPEPWIRTTVELSRWDMLLGLFTGKIHVSTTVNADPDTKRAVRDVLTGDTGDDLVDAAATVGACKRRLTVAQQRMDDLLDTLPLEVDCS